MSFIARFGQSDVVIATGQSIVIGSFGAGQTKISYGNNVPNAPVVFTLQQILQQAAVTLTPAAGTTVRIEASPACDVEYVVGTNPILTQGNPTVANALTARAGGGQALATPLTAGINRVTVCATLADSSLLPPSFAGARLTVSNFGAASMNVFPATGEQINALGANAAFAVAAGKAALFECPVVGTWQSILSA